MRVFVKLSAKSKAYLKRAGAGPGDDDESRGLIEITDEAYYLARAEARRRGITISSFLNWLIERDPLLLRVLVRKHQRELARRPR